MFFEFFYIVFFIVFLFSLIILLLLMWIYWSELLGEGLIRETIDVYECGFDSKDLSRLPFSLRFFLIIIFFVLLDIEVCLLLQFPYEYQGKFFGKRLWFIMFLIILMIGVIEELRRGFLNWKN
jgi:NADH:ubiquinone oxidoreductase subunit 3 (subunit A)